MFSTIKSKILVLIFALLCVLTCILTGVSLYTFHHSKELIIAGNNSSIMAFEGQLNKEMAEMEKEALDLAVMGEIYYQNGKHQETGEFFAKRLLKNYPNSMGNGIWFEPYKIDKNRKSSCIHALWDENGKIGFLPSCVRGDYDYFSRNWYAEIIKDLKSGKKISWTRPYKSSEVEFLMTTVGVGIYDKKKLVGIAMVDWQMDTILKSILTIKPTPNSFVLFADKTNDYIIATTEPGIDTAKVMGKSLKNLAWYSTALKEGVPFDYHGTKYIPYIKQLHNGLFLIINVPERELFSAGLHHLHVVLSVLLIACVLIIGILYFVLKKNINQPLEKLTQTAEEIGKGNLNLAIQLDQPLELAQLAAILNKMTKDIKEHIINLARVSQEKEKIESELAIAHTIQTSVLPTDFPKNEAFELVASMTAAREVGGDFYDFFPVDKTHYAFVMADVSGKGITAALYMMSAKTMIKNMLQAGYPLAEAASKVNKGLCDNHARGMFVTAFIGILDMKTGQIEYISAGHCPPLVKKGKQYTYVKVNQNLVLGITPNYIYKTGSFQLKKNNRLFLYTDGVTEAQTKTEKLYGPERLQKALNQGTGDTISRVRHRIHRFTKGANQSDDITMMEVILKKTTKRTK
ncbi:MAG: SpoIIE family protein phosphatase [Alphaproteobacteria bacterium]|nr:SpoIIE family protein phosphatase [Alphaproteobacteria bacterium]